jgi:hypothetical protein
MIQSKDQQADRTSREHLGSDVENTEGQVEERFMVTAKKKLSGLSTRANYTDSRFLEKLVPTFVDGGCHVVSVTDYFGRNLGF